MSDYTDALKHSIDECDVEFDQLENTWHMLARCNNPDELLYKLLISDTPMSTLEVIRNTLYEIAVKYAMADKGYEYNPEVEGAEFIPLTRAPEPLHENPSLHESNVIKPSVLERKRLDKIMGDPLLQLNAITINADKPGDK